MNSPKDGSNPDKAWKEIVVLFRRLCFLRRMGRSDESAQLLRKDLPEMISQWARSTNEPYTSKRTRLARMFQEEQRRVADACTLHELSLVQWQQDMIPVLTQKIAQEIKTIVACQLEAQSARQHELDQEVHTLAGQFEQESARLVAQEAILQTVQKTVETAVQKLPQAPVRIPFDDIPSIIDLINDEERSTPSARKKFSVQPRPSPEPRQFASADKIGGNSHAVNSREPQEAVA